MARLTRVSADSFEARIAYGTYFIAFTGACDRGTGQLLSKALRRDHGATVRSLRCDPHSQNRTCWLHGDGWCFSTHNTTPHSNPAGSAP